MDMAALCNRGYLICFGCRSLYVVVSRGMAVLMDDGYLLLNGCALLGWLSPLHWLSLLCLGYLLSRWLIALRFWLSR